jgi:TRAP-type C4-dicarboxylate transport system permease small subunit
MGLRDKLVKIGSGSESGLHSTSTVMVFVAALALFGMMMVTVFDVIGRYFFNSPIKGAWELVGILLVGAGTWGMAYCQVKKGHIRVDFIWQRLSRKTQVVLTSFANLLGLGAFSVLCWRSSLLAQHYLSVTRGDATDTLHIPLFPFVLALAIGTGMTALVLLFDLIHSVSEVKGK